MARSPKTYVCVKCGQPFTKWVGGIVMSPEEKQLMLRPICDKMQSKVCREYTEETNRPGGII